MAINFPKKHAAIKALEWIKNGMVIGLGTGTTADLFTGALAKKNHRENLNIQVVSSSLSTTLLARKLEMPLQALETVEKLNLYVDGADEVDSELNLIKGRGGAMVMEKVMAECAEQFIVIVGESKIVKSLGERCPVPVEVIPQASTQCICRLTQLGGEPVLRQAKRKHGPLITDHGNFILDVKFPPPLNISGLDRKLNAIPGVVGHGIFSGQASIALVGSDQGANIIRR